MFVEHKHGKLKTAGLSWFTLLLLIPSLTLPRLWLLQRTHGTCQLFTATFPCEVRQLQLGIGIQDSTSLVKQMETTPESRSEHPGLLMVKGDDTSHFFLWDYHIIHFPVNQYD